MTENKRNRQPNRFVEAVNQLAILTKPQAALLLGCTVRYIERAISSGKLRACKPTGKFVRLYRSDIDVLVEWK